MAVVVGCPRTTGGDSARFNAYGRLAIGGSLPRSSYSSRCVTQYAGEGVTVHKLSQCGPGMEKPRVTEAVLAYHRS